MRLLWKTIEGVARRTDADACVKKASAVVLLSALRRKINAGVMGLTEGEGVGTASGYMLTQPTLIT